MVSQETSRSSLTKGGMGLESLGSRFASQYFHADENFLSDLADELILVPVIPTPIDKHPTGGSFSLG